MGRKSKALLIQLNLQTEANLWSQVDRKYFLFVLLWTLCSIYIPDKQKEGLWHLFVWLLEPHNNLRPLPVRVWVMEQCQKCMTVYKLPKKGKILSIEVYLQWLKSYPFIPTLAFLRTSRHLKLLLSLKWISRKKKDQQATKSNISF